MTMARRLRWYLDSHDIDYDLLPHSHTSTSAESAEVAHVPKDRLAKCVVLEDERGYLMAILPASRRVSLEELYRRLHRRLELATEEELVSLFDDCELGACPPIARAYGIPSIVDETLLSLPEVYFEAGDHEDLVHMSGIDFLGLVSGAQFARFTRPN